MRTAKCPPRAARRLALALLALALPAACGAADPRPESRRVLFIGNSLTASNDLPATAAALAEAAGERLEWKAVLAGGSSLEDHWNEGSARRAIGRGAFDVVVLQQGPSALPESRTSLLLYAARFAAEIRKAGGRPALLMVWPSAARAGDFDRVCESYRLAAQRVGGLLLPAGEAWRAAWRRDPAIALWSPDGLHPTAAGSYLAALVVFAGLFGKTPVGLPALGLPAARASLLQEAAAEAVAPPSP
jgi:hypothetical protein